jgi:hypothetical protein
MLCERAIEQSPDHLRRLAFLFTRDGFDHGSNATIKSDYPPSVAHGAFSSRRIEFVPGNKKGAPRGTRKRNPGLIEQRLRAFRQRNRRAPERVSLML